MLAHVGFPPTVGDQCHAPDPLRRNHPSTGADLIGNVPGNDRTLGEPGEDVIGEGTFPEHVPHFGLHGGDAFLPGFVVRHLVLGVNVLELRRVRQGPHLHLVGRIGFLQRPGNVQHERFGVRCRVERVIGLGGFPRAGRDKHLNPGTVVGLGHHGCFGGFGQADLPPLIGLTQPLLRTCSNHNNHHKRGKNGENFLHELPWIGVKSNMPCVPTFQSGKRSLRATARYASAPPIAHRLPAQPAGIGFGTQPGRRRSFGFRRLPP